MNPVLELSDKLQAKKAEGASLIAKARAEARDLTPEDRTALDAVTAECTAISSDIDRLIKFDDAANPQNRGVIGLTEKEKQSYSLVAAIRNTLDGKFAGTFEHEVSVAAEKKLGKSARGFIMPQDIMEHRETRTTGGATQLVGTTGLGGHLVGTDLRSGSLIDLMRNKLVCRTLGCTTMSGLVGNVAIPTVTADPTVYWVAEDTEPSLSAFNFGQISLTPHDLAAAVAISRKLLLQSSIDIESFVRDHLATLFAIEIDRAAINGTGTGEPFGILHTTGVNAAPMSATTNANAVPTWASLLSFISGIATDNADVASMGWAINPATWAYLAGTVKVTTAQGGFLLDPGSGVNGSSIAGYKAVISNQVPNALSVKAAGASAIIFGNWAQLVLAFWSGCDVLVNPYTKSLSGTVLVVAHQDVDVGVMQPSAFATATDVKFS